MLNLFREICMRVARLWYWKRRHARFFIILGAPGAGKGTISQLLSEETLKHDNVKIPVLVMGDIFRNHIREGTPIGVKWGPVVKSGGLVPDRVVMKLLKHELKKPEYINGAILDGIPRAIGQARGLRRMLMWWGNKVNRVVLLDAEEKDLIVRISGRRTCPKKGCGKNFHIEFNPPRVENVCDSCGSGLVIRDDAKPAVVAERLRIFAETSKALLRFYDSNGQLTKVVTNNTRSVQEVLLDVLFTIEQFD